jgi:hypothetical protein
MFIVPYACSISTLLALCQIYHSRSWEYIYIYIYIYIHIIFRPFCYFSDETPELLAIAGNDPFANRICKRTEQKGHY